MKLCGAFDLHSNNKGVTMKMLFKTLAAIAILLVSTAASVPSLINVAKATPMQASSEDPFQPGDQVNPAVAYNSTDDEYLLVWHDDRSGASDNDIYCQIILPGGEPGDQLCHSGEHHKQYRA